MKTMRRLILCIALALALPLLADDMTKLTIEVKSKSGKPVEQASVIVKFVKGHSVMKLGKKIRKEWELKSNQDGIAKIPPIPKGTILIQIIAKNYPDVRPELTMSTTMRRLSRSR